MKIGGNMRKGYIPKLDEAAREARDDAIVADLSLGRTYAEVAETFDISEGRVRQIEHRRKDFAPVRGPEKPKK